MDTTSAPSETAPALWNPNAAALWSLLFSPAFGAFVHARNADALGRVEEAGANRAWFYVSLGYLAFVLVSIFIPAIPDWLFRGAAVGILLGWYLRLGKKQIRHVKENCQHGYQRKSWGKPLGVAFGCFAAFLVTIAILQWMAESVFRIVH